MAFTWLGTATAGGCWTATEAKKVTVIVDVLARLVATGCDYYRLPITTGTKVMINMKSMNPSSCILSDNRLTGPNFSDWLRNLNNVLNMEALGYILETQEIELPSGDATSDQQDAYDQWSIDDTKVRYYMFASLSNELQKQHENIKSSREILKNLRKLYGENSRIARYEISKELFRARMQEGTEVAAHV
ncbi:uncharacterized protein LOC116207968 [Punica granatum]|uniref:Uncharacterized protein LOC116207968 n=2 Tax=Punica granatum TaxID=22663 RepID=A0A6P8DUT5_PUNGR|nr:uncharacterized protein LOC116207968 [Punica granatum]